MTIFLEKIALEKSATKNVITNMARRDIGLKTKIGSAPRILDIAYIENKVKKTNSIEERVKEIKDVRKV